MDEDTASRFVSSLVKSIQALCNGYIDFSSSIEVIGHIHLNIDRNTRFNYVLTEEVSKSVSEGATVFASHSYHSQPSVSVSSKSGSDAANRNRRKSQITQNEETDPLGISSLPPEVPNTAKSDDRSQNTNRVGEGSDSSHSGNFSVLQESDSTNFPKQENSRSSCQVQESLDRRRRNAPSLHRTPSPAAKRSRSNDSSTNSAVQNPGFDVIEIKEEPEDEPAVYFGDNASQMAAGQDIQTPDFSNVVMESLDRVGQIEGTQLVAGGDAMQVPPQQQQPFPVMLHANAGVPSSTSSGGPVPGPSSDPRTASSSGGQEMVTVRWVKSEMVDSSNSSAGVDLKSFGPVHKMDRIPHLGTKTNRQKRCYVCKSMGFRRDSRFQCVVCPEKPGLCRIIYGARALMGISFTGGRIPSRVMSSKRHLSTVDNSFGNGVVNPGSNFCQQNQYRYINTIGSASQSEELERIRIKRERVRLRVQAHRARKRAAQMEAERIMAEQMKREDMLSDAELRLLLKRQKNAMHARMYRQRAKQSEEKSQMIKERAKVRQRRYVERQKLQHAYWQSIYHPGPNS